MTFSDVILTVHDKWTPLIKPVLQWLLALLGVATGIGIFLGSLKSDNASLAKELQEFKQEQRAFNATVIPNIPERISKVETILDKTDRRQIESFEELKTLIVQTRPKNAAPSLQKRQ